MEYVLLNDEVKMPQIGFGTMNLKTKMGKKYLRWQVQSGIVVIPSSITRETMLENLDVFDFDLDETDIQLIESLNTKEELGNDAYRIHMLEKFL